jgi:2-oxoglutarate ferredoxin oxidoreductase subunit delta
MQPDRKNIDPLIRWAANYCKHCFTCVNVCPVKNLEFNDDEMVSLGKCIRCQLCEKYCPDFAIEAKSKKTNEARP